VQGLPEVFEAFRVIRVGDQEIVHGILIPGLAPGDPSLMAQLQAWPGDCYLQRSPLGVELTLVRRAAPRPRERWWLHALLLVLTLASTTLSGAMLAGGDPLRLAPGEWLGMALPVPTGWAPAELLPGLWFSLPLVCTLLAHELGHYLLALRHGMDASPPYFVPAPFFVNLIGTFGAFIRLRSPLLNRVILMDVGAAGPLAGFVPALLFTFAGLWMSSVGPASPGFPEASLGVVVGGSLELPLGRSLLLDLLRALSPVAGPGLVALHPMAVAGWVGLFFTALNLVPVYQLDGGHVLYALLGRAQTVVALLFVLGLIVLGRSWFGWWFWAAVILLLGRGRVGHPPVFDPRIPVAGVRRAVGWACIVVFVLTFAPFPFPL
jgi:membrane-associated protease RseP (regulator of RpoE activity)